MKPTTRKSNISNPPAELSGHVGPDLRIDGAHTANIESNSPESYEDDHGVDLSAGDLDMLPDWQRRQINQLARLMRDRQMELDRREAELNARMANFESQQRSAALAMAEELPYMAKPAASPEPAPARSSSPLRTIEETIRAWRRKWRGQSATLQVDEAEVTDSVTVRLEKLSEAESQLAQQWALLKNARSLHSLREKEFAGYAQKLEREIEQSRTQQQQWLDQEQSQLAQQRDDLVYRESELAKVQHELEMAFEDLRVIRDELELAWAEIRVRIPSSLRRRLDQQTEKAVERFDTATYARNQATRSEIRNLLQQLELVKLEIQESQVQLEDYSQQQEAEMRRARKDLADRETLVRAQLAELRREYESLNDSKLEILKDRYQELSREIASKAA
ncbi:hypothetical protein AB1L30_20450 [Bremerella sp. JC817]|uniref:hypothetical protein n=1 Tax=Bremerella sp. JC817 TaxID=3231756 RepID=UPI003458B5F4